MKAWKRCVTTHCLCPLLSQQKSFHPLSCPSLFFCDYACFIFGQWTKFLHWSYFTYKLTIKYGEVGGYSFSNLFLLPRDHLSSSLEGVAGLSFQLWVAKAGLGVQSKSQLHSVREAWATGDNKINQVFSIFLLLWSFKTVPPDVLNTTIKLFSLLLYNYIFAIVMNYNIKYLCFLMVLGQYVTVIWSPKGAVTTKVKKPCSRGWRDVLEVKNTDCSSRGPEFGSQQPHGGSQPSVMRSGALFWCAGTTLYT